MSLIGKLLYKLYYRPRVQRATVRKFGGKANYRMMLAAEQEMRKYALGQLKIDNIFNKDGKYKVNFLTGDKFIHQTLFCTYSLFKFLGLEEARDFSVNYYSDGTLVKPLIARLEQRFPSINIISHEHILGELRNTLPAADYSFLNKKVSTHPLFKKLVYPHLDNTGLAIFLDSDMLFLSRPDFFLEWLHRFGETPGNAFCIQDVQRSYGYSDQQIASIWPASVKNNINSGMYAMRSEDINFQLIEKLVRDFEQHFGSEYYMEQLITAIILEQAPRLVVAPKADYIVLPTAAQVKLQAGTLHHYVNESKEHYFREGWKKQIPGAAAFHGTFNKLK